MWDRVSLPRLAAGRTSRRLVNETASRVNVMVQQHVEARAPRRLARPLPALLPTVAAMLSRR